MFKYIWNELETLPSGGVKVCGLIFYANINIEQLLSSIRIFLSLGTTGSSIFDLMNPMRDSSFIYIYIVISLSIDIDIDICEIFQQKLEDHAIPCLSEILWVGQGLVDTPVTCPEKEEQRSEQHSAGFLVNLIRPTRKY